MYLFLLKTTSCTYLYLIFPRVFRFRNIMSNQKLIYNYSSFSNSDIFITFSTDLTSIASVFTKLSSHITIGLGKSDFNRFFTKGLADLIRLTQPIP